MDGVGGEHAKGLRLAGMRHRRNEFQGSLICIIMAYQAEVPMQN